MRHSSIEWTLNTKLKRTSDRAARGPLLGARAGPAGGQPAGRAAEDDRCGAAGRTTSGGPPTPPPAGQWLQWASEEHNKRQRRESRGREGDKEREREMRDGDRVSERVAKDDSLQEYRRLHATVRGSGTRGNYEAP